MSRPGGASDAFNPKLIAAVIAAGVVAFIALWALIALGPQIRSGQDGGEHALSNAAPGFAGIVDLIERSGNHVDIRRSENESDAGDRRTLLVLTPTHRTRPEEISRLVAAHGDGPVLLILPKWRTERDPTKSVKPGWVTGGFLDSPPTKLVPLRFASVERIARYSGPAGRHVGPDPGEMPPVTLPLPLSATQVIDSDDMTPLIRHPQGGAILARTPNSLHYVLADPDFLNNLAFHDGARAQAGLRLIDAIADDSSSDRLAFDVTLNGLGGGQNLLRHAFTPPFIGITLCLIAAGLLALWQAWIRFGPAIKPRRAIPISKAALITNSADLVKQAGRELDGASHYAANLRTILARRLHAPPGLDDAATDRWIDRMIAPGGESFSVLAQRLPLARTHHELLADAQALHRIRKELLRDS